MVPVAAAHKAEVQDDCHQKVKKIDSYNWNPAIEHPSVNECCQRQEDEAQDKEKKAVVIRPIQVSGQEEKQRQRDAWEQQNQN